MTNDLPCAPDCCFPMPSVPACFFPNPHPFTHSIHSFPSLEILVLTATSDAFCRCSRKTPTTTMMLLRPPLLSEAARTVIQVAAITKSCPPASCSLLRVTTAHARLAHILATLRDNPGAHQKRIRLGRGPSSGKGKTSGRGHKGQKQHGHVHPWFQGGQTPLIRVRGQMGFTNL